MKKIKALIAVLLVISMFALVACGEKKPVDQPTPTEGQTQTEALTPVETEPETENVVEPTTEDEGEGSQYKENFDAIAKVMDSIDKGENVLYSPLSLNFALGLVSNGASDEVKNEFENYFGSSFNQYNKFYKDYINGLDGNVEVANAFYLKNIQINQKFKDDIGKYYNAESDETSFDEAFVKRVNEWCAEKTHGMIDKLFDTPPTTDAIAINALYFEDEWKDKYKEKDIRETTFNISQNDTVKVDGLYSSEDIYFQNSAAQGFMKYYKNGRYAFIGILPNNEDASFKFSDLDIQSLLDSKRETEVNVMIPKFTFDNSNDLTDIIDDIGLSKLRSDTAFDKFCQDGTTMTLSKIFQKTKIELDENGTKAAAVTDIEMEATSVQKNVPPTVYLDKPFAFLIYDTENDVVLFAGKVVNPKA